MNFLKFSIGLWVLLVVFLASPRLVHAATFHAINDSELQVALDTAGTNNQDNTIQIEAGHFTGPFSYDNSSGHALTVIGNGQSTTYVTALAGDDCFAINSNGALAFSNLTFQACSNNAISYFGSSGTNTDSVIISVDHVTFYHNTNYGVLVGFWNGDQGGSLTVTDSIFDGNAVSVSVDGGSVAFPVTFSRNTVINSTTHGLYLHRTTDGSDMVIDHNYFANNSGQWGVGFAAQAYCNCKITAASNLIVNNSGNDDTAGVGVVLETNTSDVGGATMIDFINNTVVHNIRSSVNGGGLLLNSNTPNAVLNFYNNIFWDNQATDDNGLGADAFLSLSDYGAVHFSHNDIHTLEVDGDLTNFESTANLDTDPLFTDGSGATAYQTVLEGSRIVGAGTALAPSFPSTDYAGNVWRSNPDIGAFSLLIKYPTVSSHDSPANNSSVSCAPEPVNSPVLFQINTNSNSASLFYTPSNEASNYQISYGFDSTAEQFRTITNQGQSTGVLSYRINYLPRLATMYFKVYSQNNCGQGRWSNIMKIKVQANKKYYIR